jgi:hypothetical protein
MIELEFEHAEQVYRVRRTFSARGRGKTSVDLEQVLETRTENGHGLNLSEAVARSWIPLTRASAKETDAFLCDLLGLSKETFRDSSYLRQGDGGYADPDRDPKRSGRSCSSRPSSAATPSGRASSRPPGRGGRPPRRGWSGSRVRRRRCGSSPATSPPPSTRRSRPRPRSPTPDRRYEAAEQELVNDQRPLPGGARPGRQGGGARGRAREREADARRPEPAHRRGRGGCARDRRRPRGARDARDQRPDRRARGGRRTARSATDQYRDRQNALAEARAARDEAERIRSEAAATRSARESTPRPASRRGREARRRARALPDLRTSPVADEAKERALGELDRQADEWEAKAVEMDQVVDRQAALVAEGDGCSSRQTPRTSSRRTRSRSSRRGDVSPRPARLSRSAAGSRSGSCSCSATSTSASLRRRQRVSAIVTEAAWRSTTSSPSTSP